MSVHGRNFRRRVIGILFILLFALTSSGFLALQLPASAAPNLSVKWSRNLGSNAKAFIAPLAADLVGDSDPEIVLIGGTIDGGSDGTVTVLNGDNGATVWQRTFPVTAGGYSYGVGMHTCFEIADLYNDGRQKILVAAEGGLLVLNGNDGSVNWSNPAAPGRQNYLAVVDVDGDGYKEIFVNRGNAPYPGWLGYDWITMLSYDGTILRQGWSWHPCWGGLTVGDTNNDGKFELYQGDRDNSYSNSADQFKEGGQGLRALDALTLTPLWTDQNILMSSHAPMLADVDKDGIQDVVVAWQSDGIAVFNSSDGSVLTTGGKYRASSSISGVDAHSQPTVADLDNDGNLEFVVAYNSQPVVWDLYDWRQDARLVNETGGAIEVFEPPKAGDVTGDGLLDIIAVTVPGDIYIYSQSYSLVEHVKQPGFYGGSAMTLVQDVDGDGRNELIVTSSQGVTLCYDTPAPTPNPKPRTDKSFYSEARRGAAEYVPAPIPVSPTLNLEWPVNTATNQARNPTLSVKVADFQKNLMDITFQTNASGSWASIRSYNDVGNGVYTAIPTDMNQYGRKYYWRLTASDGSHSTTETYSFTTLSTPPTQGTPSLITNVGSLVASNVSTGDANGDAVDNIYSWYVDDVPYTNLYLPFDSRDSNNPMITETVFSDGFESGWGNWASYDSWTRVTSERYSGSYSAYAGESATYLTSDNIDISAGEGLTLSFSYRDDDIDDDDNVLLQFWNGTTYHDIFELGNTEPEDTWHFYSAQTFRATFNSPDFHFRFSASSIDAGEGLWIDDLSIVVPSRTKDYSGYANDATIHGAQWTSDGVVGGAYVFDGRTDYMRIPDVSSLDGDGSWNELSIEFWVKPLSEARGARIIAKKVAADSTGDYMVGFQTSGSPTNTLFFGVYNGSSWQDTWSDANTHLAAGNWYHVVCTYESGPGLKIYINGTLRNSKALTGPIFNDDVSVSVFGSPLFIGQDGSGDQSRRYFNGVLDEVKIYSRALSADQIVQDYVEAGSGQSSRATIVPAETVEDEVWRCGVTPNDSFGDGLTVLSNPVTVGAPPAQYGLLVETRGSGTTNATGTHTYLAGTVVAVQASPSLGWVLSNWLLNGTDMGSTPNPYVVVMTENRNLTAVFAEKPKFNLLVEVSGSGSTNATGTALYDSGTVVAVHATPGSGWTLSHWLLNGTNVGSVNPYSVTMTENRNLTAVFVAVQYGLLVEVSGSGITNATGTATYDSGTVVHVLATPSAGWTLNKWLLNGSDSGSANPYTLTMTANYKLTATFTPEDFVPLSGWVVDSSLTNAPYTLNSTESNLSLELAAVNTNSKVVVYSLGVPSLNLGGFDHIDVAVTGTSNAKILLRFFMDNGAGFDVVYWSNPTTLDAISFDLSPYAGRTLTIAYVALMSSDGLTASIDITGITFVATAPPPVVPLSGWTVDPSLTNAAYTLNSTETNLSLKLTAVNTSSKVTIYTLGVPMLNLGDYDHIDVAVTGTANARILLRFFMDNGAGFDVVYWADPATLNAISFDLSAYSGRTLTIAYIALMSSDGLTASVDITDIAFIAAAPPPVVPLSGWAVDPPLTNAAYTLNSTVTNLSLGLTAVNTSSKVAIYTLGVPALNLTNYDHIDVTVTGTTNARILLRFFLDDGTGFDVVYWADPTTLNAINFDLSVYAGRTLAIAYVALMSSDSTLAGIDITQIAFIAA